MSEPLGKSWCRINGNLFEPVPGCNYRHEYIPIVKEIRAGLRTEIETYRTLLKIDSWFFIFFVLGIKTANHPFIVNLCRELDEGPPTNTLHLYAREHFKSTAITIVRSIQDVLKDPEKCVGIFSHTKAIANGFLRSIKQVLEESQFLKDMFPDVLFQNPEKEAFRWSEEIGLFVNRKGVGRKEATFEAWGLIEGMPTSKHFDILVFDDVETPDMVYSPEMIQKLCDAYDMAMNLGTADGWIRTVGTTYSHVGLLQKLKARKKEDGSLQYQTILKPATVDATPSGASVFLPEERLSLLRQNLPMFYAQQLLDPTPRGTQKLDSTRLKKVRLSEMPDKLHKFMVIDPAGTRKDRVGDSWAMFVVGVEPYIDDIGASNIFLLDGIIEVMDQDDAMRSAVELYSRNGRILTLGIEKVGMSSAEVHIANALRARGKYLTVESGGLTVLRPGGRPKADRIEGNLMWPLNNGKIHVAPTLPNNVFERLVMEMNKYPVWHDDALDALSYVYDLIKDYRFGKIRERTEVAKTLWDRIGKKPDRKNSWMYC